MAQRKIQIELWAADLFYCDCGELTITDFARLPIWTKRGGFNKSITFPNGTPSITVWLDRIKEITEADKESKMIGVVYVEPRGAP